MISIDALNEEGFISAINEVNKLTAINPSHYQTRLARKKLDMKYKLLLVVSRTSAQFNFKRNGVELFQLTRFDDGRVEFWTALHKVKNPNYHIGFRYEEREFTNYCSREAFYEYIAEHPPFFEWLLWNQL
jgi:hypothetical protein